MAFANSGKGNGTGMKATICGDGRTARETNREIKGLVATGCREIDDLEPDAQHNLGVALLDPVTARD